MIEKICYILIGILVLSMIRRIWINVNIGILNIKATKIYNYFSANMLCMGLSNIDNLIIGQLFSRCIDIELRTGYKVSDTGITFVARFENDNDLIYLKRLYIVDTETILNLLSENDNKLDEEILMNDKTIMYLELEDTLHCIEFWCGKLRFNELKINENAFCIKSIKKLINLIYNQCRLKGNNTLSPVCIEFSIYCKSLSKIVEGINK